MNLSHAANLALRGAIVGYFLTLITGTAVLEMLNGWPGEGFILMAVGIIWAPLGAVIGGVIGAIIGLRDPPTPKPEQMAGSVRASQFTSLRTGVGSNGANMVDGGKGRWRIATAVVIGLSAGGAALFFTTFYGVPMLDLFLSQIGLSGIDYGVVLVLAPMAAGLGALAGVMFVLLVWRQPGNPAKKKDQAK